MPEQTLSGQNACLRLCLPVAILISPVNPVFVPIDDDADAIFSAFAADNDAKAKANRGRGLDTLYANHAIEHAKRVALVVAGSINNESPAIDRQLPSGLSILVATGSTGWW